MKNPELKRSQEQEKKEISALTDSQLIEIVRQGQKDLFAELVSRYQPKLLGFFFRFTGSLQEAEDLAQETFINTYFNLNKFDIEKDFYPWLFTIAHHLAVNNYHKRNKIRLIDIEKVPELEDEKSVYNDVVERESKELVRKKLSSMKMKYRSVLELRYLKEKSYQEISEDLDLPLNTVKSRLFRAKSILGKAFNKFNFDLTGGNASLAD